MSDSAIATATAAPSPAGRKVSFFDTTLRDGEQAPRNGMTAEAKVDLALRLEAIGVDVIEVGFPASSANDFRAARSAARKLSRATVATFARSTESDILRSVEAVGVARHQVQLLVSSSDLHLTHKRGISRAECLREMVGAVRFTASLGVTDISVGLEDSSRSTPDLLRALVDSAIEAGARTVVLADTSGCLIPDEAGALVAMVKSWMPAGAKLSLHCHDDMGMALANSIAGLVAGADEVQTTLGGVGERSGNTALEEVAAVLSYKGRQLGLSSEINTKLLYDSYRALESSMRLDGGRNKAIVGQNSFATSAGIHQDGLLQKPETYEFLVPEDFGRQRQVLVGRHSGRAILRYLLDELNVAGDERLVGVLYDELIGGRVDNDVVTLEEFSKRILAYLEGAPASGARG